MNKHIFFLLITFSLFNINVWGQSDTCQPNVDFEMGNYNYWNFFQGTCCSPFNVSTPATPPITGRIQLTSGTATDYYGKFPVVAPGGGSYSLKLGSNDASYKSDKARYYIRVPAGSTKFALVYRYAVVLEDPSHTASQQPRFTVTTIDSATGANLDCSQFSYVAGALPGFSVSTVSSNVYYKPWASAVIDLSGSSGRTVIVDFARGSCGLGGHFGYGYVDMGCGLFAASINTCTYGATMTLNGPPGFMSYQWVDSAMTTTVGTGQNAVITTPTTTKTFHLILTPYSGFGCKDTLTTKIVVSPLSLTVPTDDTLCKGDTMTLRPTVVGNAVPYTYSWTPSLGLSCTTCLNPLLTAASTTKYYFTASDSNNCSRTDSFTVYVKSLPNVKAQDTTICIGDTASLLATGAISYRWSLDTTLSCELCSNPIAYPHATKNYLVTGLGANNCSYTDTVTVKVNALPIISSIDKVICFKDSVSLLATGAKTYTWSPISGLSCANCPNPKASPLLSTYYIIKGTDTNKCIQTDTLFVKVNPLPILKTTDTSICFTDSVLLNISGAKTYTWSPTSGLSCDTCDQTMASPISSTQYIITGVDTNNCINKDTLSLLVHPLPVLADIPDQSICIGVGKVISSGGAIKYAWYPTTGLSCDTCESTLVMPNTTTKYIIRGTDKYTCVNKDSFLVTVNLPLQISVDTVAPICLGQSTTLKVSGSNTYLWSPSTDLSCATCATTSASPKSTTTYMVVGADNNGCLDTALLIVSVNSLPIITTNQNLSICDGSSEQLWADGAETYKWFPNLYLDCNTCDSPITSPSTNIIYTVVGTDSNGCIDSNKVNVSVIFKDQISYPTNDTICKGEELNLLASGGSSYQWTPSNSLSDSTVPNPIFRPLQTTNYRLIIIQGNCFFDTVNFMVLVKPVPSIQIIGDSVIYQSAIAQLELKAADVEQLIWSPAEFLSCSDCPNPQAKIEKTTTFYLTAIAPGGCKVENDFTIKVKCDPKKVFIPNTFSPNGDGENDTFYPIGSGVKVVNDFFVYNRWGEVVYEAHNFNLNDPKIGWNGTFKGQNLSPDVFVYMMNASCIEGDRFTLKGNITILK